MRIRTVGSAIAVIAASLSVAMMSFGVPFGTQRPYQTEI
jgi:predicted MFS family arabinose efflux permease